MASIMHLLLLGLFFFLLLLIEEGMCSGERVVEEIDVKIEKKLEYRITVREGEGKMPEGITPETITQNSDDLLSALKAKKLVEGLTFCFSFQHLELLLKQKESKELRFPSLIKSADERLEKLIKKLDAKEKPQSTANDKLHAPRHEVEFTSLFLEDAESQPGRPEGVSKWIDWDVDAMLFVLAYRRGVRAMVEKKADTSSAIVHKIIHLNDAAQEQEQAAYYDLSFKIIWRKRKREGKEGEIEGKVAKTKV